MRQYFENAKISAVRSLADDLFSAHSNMVDYVYYLVCLCFGILGVKYFSYSYNNKCLVHSSRIRIRMVLPRKLSGFLDRSTGRLIFFFDKDDSPVNPYVFRVVETKWGPRTNLNRFTSYYRALSFRVLTPSLLLLVVGVSDVFVRD